MIVLPWCFLYYGIFAGDVRSMHARKDADGTERTGLATREKGCGDGGKDGIVSLATKAGIVVAGK